MAIEVKTCNDPHAVELHRDGKCEGVVRFHGGKWTLAVPDVFVDFEVIEAAVAFKRNRDAMVAPLKR